MKVFMVFTLILILFYFLGFIKYNRSNNQEWMGKDFTIAIKGFSILTVIWAHTGAKFDAGGIQFIAGVGVALFLICSGYGLELSYEKNGLKNFWKKRILKVCIPFWIIELIGLILLNRWSLKGYILDMFFIKAATTYGWFMRYIVICYILFFFIQLIFDKLNFCDNKKQIALFFVFCIWFFIESLWFSNPNMPFLEARQMFSFPIGVFLAVNKAKIMKSIQVGKFYIIIVGLLMGLFFMAVTQIQYVKDLPYLLSNSMSLLTVLPIAVSILVIGMSFPKLMQNFELHFLGKISYEIYLVHAFTLEVVKGSFKNTVVFIFITLLISYVLHLFIIKGYKYG